MLNDNAIWLRERDAARHRKQQARWWRRLPGGCVLIWLGILVVALGIAVLNRKEVAMQSLCTLSICAAFLQVLYLANRAVVAGAGTIAREREQRTLETLLATPAGSYSIINGKFLGVVLPLVREATCALPLTGLLLLDVGPRPPDFSGLSLWAGVHIILSLFAVSLATITFFAAVGIAFSVGSRTASQAATRGSFVLAALVFFTMLVDGILSQYGVSLPATMVLNPMAATFSVILAPLDSGFSGSLWAYSWYFTVAGYLTLTLLLWLLAAERLERISTD